MRIRLVGATATAVLCLLAGCQPGDQPTLETVGAGTSQASVSSSATAAPSSTSMNSGEMSTIPTSSEQVTTSPEEQTATSSPDDGLTDQERADRAAIESQWIKSTDVYRTLARLPEGERQAVAAAVAVDPALSLMLRDAQTLSEKGWDTYGTIEHRISWPKSIDGANEALINDCQDASQAGSLEIATGTKKTVGVERALFQGSMRKGDDGAWRLAQSYFLKDEQC